MSVFKKLWLCFYIAIAAGTLWAGSLQAQAENQVLVIDVDGPVTPVMLSFIERSIEEADASNAEMLVVRLNTPGGSVDLTRRIIQTIISADVPVVIYVWPPGGMAASAGTFITLAGHAAAMAPTTSIGAASPIDGSGQDIDETLRSKIENMLVADIKSLSERRGEEALTWAQQAVTEAKAATADEALELGVIDFIADDLDDLLQQLDGFEIDFNGDTITLNTADAPTRFIESTTLENILSAIANPSIALLLISMGSLALVYEIINPGGYISGVIGAILLLVGLYAVGQLPVNYAGLALIILAIGLFVAELFTPTFGVLTATGVVSFILGGLIMFNTSEFAYDMPLPSIIGIPIGMAGIIGFGFRKAMQAMHNQPTTGQEAMLGSTGTVKVALEPEGTILIWGERWHARSENGQPISKGSRVEVTKMDGFTLTVKAAE